jgi:hypothetical protein
MDNDPDVACPTKGTHRPRAHPWRACRNRTDCRHTAGCIRYRKVVEALAVELEIAELEEQSEELENDEVESVEMDRD